MRPDDAPIRRERGILPSLFSNTLGAVAAAAGQGATIYSLDARVKPSSNEATSAGNMPWLRSVVYRYRDLPRDVLRSVPLRAYKYVGHNSFKTVFETRCYGAYVSMFGHHADIAIVASSATLTGVIEPWLFMPFSNWGDRPLAHLKRASTWRVLWQGAAANGMVLHAPACVGLFTASAVTDVVLGNQDKRDWAKSLIAKYVGAVSGLLLSQPGQVVYDIMRQDRVSFWRACSSVTLRHALTHQLFPRLGYCHRIAIGYLLADGLMAQAARRFGHYIQDDDDDNRFQPE